ncbi:MAG: alginate lyase family protein [Planctomycetes bacterium]|nr:alginate lyase family protein [Planctomycetota bacterium]
MSNDTFADPSRYQAYRLGTDIPFFFHRDQRKTHSTFFAEWDVGEIHPNNIAGDLERGVTRYFEHLSVRTGNPPAWNSNGLTGKKLPSDRHWSDIRDFGSGDIKVVWEPSRFAFTYALVRMYWRTGDDSFAEMFWQLVEDWRENNPPQYGPNWKCGQEVALRVMAWCFGFFGFADSPATTAHRLSLLAQMIAVSGKRIHGNLSYALSQQNNHGIGEATGLFTIGLLFPEFRDANHWKRTGRKLLERLGRQLIYDDGGFSQHSLNYHRVMLQNYIWSLRLGELHSERFSSELYDRIDNAGKLLLQLQDKASGEVPCYGQNDGALILPLNNCKPRDFRPVVQAAAQLTRRTHEYDRGPWDEDILWLFGRDAVDASCRPTEQNDLAAKDSGYFTLRGSNGFTFVRAAKFRHRPSQADCLHTDIWWRGQNIAVDAGTYSYNSTEPWDNPLSRTEYHNTVTVDGSDQMDRASRFLWLPWLSAEGSAVRRSAKGLLAYWEGKHDGYKRLKDPVTHRRAILRLGDEHWLVLDYLAGRIQHTFRLHWLHVGVPFVFDDRVGRLTLQTERGPFSTVVASSVAPVDFSVVQADAKSPRGWHAPSYMAKEPATSFASIARANSVHFWTLLGPDAHKLDWESGSLKVVTERWEAHVVIRSEPNASEQLVSQLSLQGTLEDSMEFNTCMSC